MYHNWPVLTTAYLSQLTDVDFMKNVVGQVIGEVKGHRRLWAVDLYGLNASDESTADVDVFQQPTSHVQTHLNADALYTLKVGPTVRSRSIRLSDRLNRPEISFK